MQGELHVELQGELHEEMQGELSSLGRGGLEGDRSCMHTGQVGCT